MSPPFKAAKGLLDFPLLPRESPHRDSHSLLRTCCGISTAHGELVNRMTSPIKVVHLQSLSMCHGHFFGRQGIPNFHDIYDMVKKTGTHQDVDMFQKNSPKKQHFKDPNISPLHTSIHPSGCWIMLGSYPDPQVTVSPKSHLWGDTICPASAPKHFGCRWRSPKHNGPRCFCREGFWWADIMPNDSLISKYTRRIEEPNKILICKACKVPRLCAAKLKKLKKPRSCQLEQLQSRHGKRNHPLLTLEVIHRIHSWRSIHVRYIHLLFRYDFPLVEKKQTYIETKQFFFNKKSCQRNKHPF